MSQAITLPRPFFMFAQTPLASLRSVSPLSVPRRGFPADDLVVVPGLIVGGQTVVTRIGESVDLCRVCGIQLS